MDPIRRWMRTKMDSKAIRPHPRKRISVWRRNWSGQTRKFAIWSLRCRRRRRRGAARLPAPSDRRRCRLRRPSRALRWKISLLFTGSRGRWARWTASHSSATARRIWPKRAPVQFPCGPRAKTNGAKFKLRLKSWPNGRPTKAFWTFSTCASIAMIRADIPDSWTTLFESSVSWHTWQQKKKFKRHLTHAGSSSLSYEIVFFSWSLTALPALKLLRNRNFHYFLKKILIQVSTFTCFPVVTIQKKAGTRGASGVSSGSFNNSSRDVLRFFPFILVKLSARHLLCTYS